MLHLQILTHSSYLLEPYTLSTYMDYLLTPHKHSSNCHKKRLNQHQLYLLETSFTFNKKLDSDRKCQLAQELNIPARQIAIWYQNKRARCKNQTLEFDHRTMKERLENVLADNNRLKREAQRLREELHKTQQYHIIPSSLNTAGFNYYSVSTLSPPSCTDQDGSSSARFLNNGFQNYMENEFYACLIGDGSESDHRQFGKP